MIQLYDNGKITIPKSIRERNKLKANDVFEIYERGNEIILRPSKPNYNISEIQMIIIRKLYNMVKDTDLLEESEIAILKEACGITDVVCPKCGENLYLTNNNTYKCIKCEN